MKPDKSKPAGYGGSPKELVEVIGEWDVMQARNKRAGYGATLGGRNLHIIRQIGLAKDSRAVGITTGPWAKRGSRLLITKPVYAVYSHSQVSNAWGKPSSYIELTREDLERLWTTIGKELFKAEMEPSLRTGYVPADD